MLVQLGPLKLKNNMSDFLEIDRLPADLIENAERSSSDNMRDMINGEYIMYLGSLSRNAFFKDKEDFKTYLLNSSDKFVGTKEQLIQSNGGIMAGIISLTTDVPLFTKTNNQFRVKVEFCFSESPIKPRSKDIYLGDITLI